MPPFLQDERGLPTCSSSVAVLERQVPLQKYPRQAALMVRTWHSRGGVTVLDLAIVLVLAVLLVFVLMPIVYQAAQRVVRTGCEFNLRNIGIGFTGYAGTHGESLPVGSGYQNQPASPWGTSWWVDLLPHLGATGSTYSWKQGVSSGSFSFDTPNPNYAQVDGLRPGVMTCPASPLPVFNDPRRHISAANRESLGRSAWGLIVPTYVAIAGSAPDMRQSGSQPGGTPNGRNTRDASLGILSASGAFPPNRSVRLAALRDGLQHTMLVGEQSDWIHDRQFEPPVLYDARSAWPEGAYIGCGAPYGELNPTADGVNGSGEERCFNVTTVRYPINHRLLARGVLAGAATRIPPSPRLLPEIKLETYGPGHNQGLFSAHAGGLNVLFADGHVRFLSNETDLGVLLLLATRDDGQLVTLPPGR